MKCLVCDGPGADLHFGGLSCRACAAFFRRFFHAKKMVIECTCPNRVKNSHPCRYCRIQKCFSAGMTPERVQQSRDKHTWKCTDGKMICSSEPCIDTNTPSPSETHLTTQDTFLITWTADCWSTFGQRKSKKYDTMGCNIFEASSHTHYEMRLMWKLVETIFPRTMDLSKSDKSAMLANFAPRWWLLEPVLDCAKDGGAEREKCEQMVTSFYSGAFQDGKEMSRKQILNTFGPYYWWYYSKLIQPIIEKKFDLFEFLAVIWIFFFDSAHTNLSEDCATLCRENRKMIQRELKWYQKDQRFDETRIVDSMEILPIMEKAVEKFEEELLVCQMNNVVIHEDFVQAMKQQRV